MRLKASSCADSLAPRANPFQRVGDPPLRTHVAGHVAAQQLQVAAHHLQQVVEVVRHAAGELADRLHLLRLAQPGLGDLALGQRRGHLLFQHAGAVALLRQHPDAGQRRGQLRRQQLEEAVVLRRLRQAAVTRRHQHPGHVPPGMKRQQHQPVRAGVGRVAHEAAAVQDCGRAGRRHARHGRQPPVAGLVGRPGRRGELRVGDAAMRGSEGQAPVPAAQVDQRAGHVGMVRPAQCCDEATCRLGRGLAAGHRRQRAQRPQPALVGDAPGLVGHDAEHARDAPVRRADRVIGHVEIRVLLEAGPQLAE